MTPQQPSGRQAASASQPESDSARSARSPGSPRPNRLRTPRWLDARLVAGLILVVASVLVGAKVVAGARHTHRMLAVNRDLAAGSTVRSGDLTHVDVKLPHRGIYLDDPTKAIGRRLDRPLSKGELLPTAALRTARESTTISVPLQSHDAPRLRRGQRIEIWLSTPTCRSTVLLRRATVQDVHAGADTIGAGSGQDVVLDVSPQLARRVVAALADKDAVIRAGVLRGAPSQAASSAPAASPLPAIKTCLASGS